MRLRSRRLHRRGLTLVEVVMALAILTIIMAGLGSATATSVRATQEANTLHLARQAGQCALDDLRAVTSVQGGAMSAYIGLPKVTVAGVQYVSLDTSNAYANVLAGPVTSGVIRGPAAGPMIRYRVMSEAEYNALWGTTLDLNRNSAVDNTLDINYMAMPVAVEVSYRDHLGTPGVVRFTALFNDEPAIDTDRAD